VILTTLPFFWCDCHVWFLRNFPWNGGVMYFDGPCMAAIFVALLTMHAGTVHTVSHRALPRFNEKMSILYLVEILAWIRPCILMAEKLNFSGDLLIRQDDFFNWPPAFTDECSILWIYLRIKEGVALSSLTGCARMLLLRLLKKKEKKNYLSRIYNDQAKN